MKEKLLAHFQKIGARRFVVGTVITLILMDFLNGYFLRVYWVMKGKSQQFVMQAMNHSQVDPAEIQIGTINEALGLVDRAFFFFLFIILVNNLFFYFFYLKRKLWAQGFVLFYTITAVIFSAAMMMESWSMGPKWFVLNLLNIPIYFYLYLGIKLLKSETTDVIPVAEKKGQ